MQQVAQLADRVANSKTKAQLKFICEIFNIGYNVQQNFTI